MGSNLKVSGSLRWHVPALLPLARARRRWRARWQGGGERMSATEGLIDIRDMTIVIGLSQSLSNPLPHPSNTIAVGFFSIRPLGRRPSSPWHTRYLIKKPTADFKKKKRYHLYLQKWSVGASRSDWLMSDWVQHTERHLLISWWTNEDIGHSRSFVFKMSKRVYIFCKACMTILFLRSLNHYNLTLLIASLVCRLISLSNLQQLTEEKADGLANEAARSVGHTCLSSHVVVTLNRDLRTWGKTSYLTFV